MVYDIKFLITPQCARHNHNTAFQPYLPLRLLPFVLQACPRQPQPTGDSLLNPAMRFASFPHQKKEDKQRVHTANGKGSERSCNGGSVMELEMILIETDCSINHHRAPPDGTEGLIRKYHHFPGAETRDRVSFRRAARADWIDTFPFFHLLNGCTVSNFLPTNRLLASHGKRALPLESVANAPVFLRFAKTMSGQSSGFDLGNRSTGIGGLGAKKKLTSADPGTRLGMQIGYRIGP